MHQIITMVSDKITTRPTDIIVVTARGRKTSDNIRHKKTLYFPITREIRQQLKVLEGETFTLGVLKRDPPSIESGPEPSDFKN